MSQLSLVFFTVLAQSAVGMFIALGLVEMLGKPSDSSAEKAMNKAFISVWVILGVAALASITHLGQPLRMFNVIFGLEHMSALSLEIVGLSLFGGVGVTFTGLKLFNLMPAIRKLLLPIAMILGVVFILLIANVYTLETVPTWNTDWTCFQFIMTAAVVGPISAATVLRLFSGKLGKVQSMADKALATCGWLALVVAMTGYAGYLFWLGQLDITGNPFTMEDYHLNLVMVRSALLMAGMMFWVVSALRGNNSNSTIALIGMLMVLAGELTSRVFFYDIYISASAGM
ncbi:dimethyl sulfoxide reductase [Endozoicomonas sp. (ex Bugula neritina AB1)]|nr:dimethyl sulfoxide reductase [Endozoicomonas sp. (ex Bugula neritina AB1)]